MSFAFKPQHNIFRGRLDLKMNQQLEALGVELVDALLIDT